jgi:hypothetical protein
MRSSGTNARRMADEDAYGGLGSHGAEKLTRQLHLPTFLPQLWANGTNSCKQVVAPDLPQVRAVKLGSADAARRLPQLATASAQ